MYSFEVYKIFYSGLQEYDKNITYIGLKKGQSLLGYDFNEYTGLIIENNQNLSIDVPYPFYYETWKELCIIIRLDAGSTMARLHNVWFDYLCWSN